MDTYGVHGLGITSLGLAVVMWRLRREIRRNVVIPGAVVGWDWRRVMRMQSRTGADRVSGVSARSPIKPAGPGTSGFNFTSSHLL